MLTHWKEREGVYRNRRARIARDVGYVPAYATALGEAPIDVEPPATAKRGRRGAAPIDEEAGEQLSKDEFDELVREIGPELAEQSGRAPAGVGLRRGRRAGATDAKRGEEAAGVKEDGPAPDPAADLTPEDLVLKDQPARRGKPRRPRNRRHGRAR